MGKKSSIPQLNPCKGYLLLLPTDDDQIEGIPLAGVEGKPQRAKVLAVGADTYHASGNVLKAPAKKGDIVIHSSVGFENIKYKGEEYRMCPFERILAVFEK